MVVGGGPYGAYAFETASQPVFVGEINPFVNGLLSLDPATGAADAWPPVVGSVRALARWGGSLVLGGDFQSIGGDHQLNGSQHVGGLAIVSDPTAAGVGDRPAGGTHLAMSLPQPQPARAGVVVILSLSRATSVSVHVLDTMGRLERTVLADAPLTAGRQPLSVDVSGLAPGLHWLHVSANGEQAGRKIVVAR